MNSIQNHIVDKFYLEVNTSNAELAYSIKDNIDIFLTNYFSPGLERLLEKLDHHNTIVRFDELSVELNVNKWENFNDISVEICKQLEEKLATEMNFAKAQKQDLNLIEKGVSTHSTIKNIEETFVFFSKMVICPGLGKLSTLIK